nr:HAD family hydrolase [Angustibacter aerolatus]
MQRVRMVATDLDGTLVRADGTVSPRTVAAVQACRAAGVHVVYVTGRPPRWMQAVVEQTGHGGAAICGNGAVVVDLDDDRVRRLAPARAGRPARGGRPPAPRDARRELRRRDARGVPPARHVRRPLGRRDRARGARHGRRASCRTTPAC